ncbi:WD40-repeat-containing domain protein [Obelidium mucronatum]|nr:WD40-repeat-containing domain protein [Obelidium mucronatum]
MLSFRIPISERPLFASTVATKRNKSVAPQLVVGGANHGLTQICLLSKRENGKLYSKDYGHQEWVTCVESLHLPERDLHVASGGMDSKVCVWKLINRKPALQRTTRSVTEKVPEAQCFDLIGHCASISCLRATEQPHFLASGSYDSTIKIWDLSSSQQGGSCVATLSQEGFSSMMRTRSDSNWDSTLDLSQLSLHTTATNSFKTSYSNSYKKRRPEPLNAVLGFINTDPTAPTSTCLSSKASPYRVTSFTRSGVIYTHDLNEKKRLDHIPPTTSIQAHHGPISSLLLLSSHPGGDVVVSSGLLDGAIRCFDLRIAEGRGRCVGRCEGLYNSKQSSVKTSRENPGGGITMMVGVGNSSTASDVLHVVASGGGGDASLKIVEVRGGGKMRTLKGLEVVKEVPPTTLWTSYNVEENKSLTLPPGSPSSTAYGLTSVPQVDGVVVAWGDGRVQLIRNLTKSSDVNIREQTIPGNQSIVSPHMVCASAGTVVETLSTRSSGIKNAIRSFSVYETDRNRVMGLSCSGDDGIVLGFEINY